MVCWFCGTAEAQSKLAVRLQLYGEVEASDPDINKKRIAYSTQRVDVPRCPDCKKKHARAKFLNVLCVIAGVVILAAGVSALTTLPGWIWGLALGLGTGFLTMFLVVKSMTLKGIKKVSAAKKDYPEVVDLLCKGYKFGKAPSYEESISKNGSIVESGRSEPPADTETGS